MSIHETDIGGDDSEADMGIDLEGNSEDVQLSDLEALRGVVKFPIRVKCTTLSWNTLAQALNEKSHT